MQSLVSSTLSTVYGLPLLTGGHETLTAVRHIATTVDMRLL